MIKPSLVSICIPAYNCAPFIRHTLLSVFSQSYENFEVLIQENASTDATLEVINTFLAEMNDPRFQLQKNTTTLSADRNWNLAIQGAKGEFVKLLCADDLIDQDCLSKQVEILNDEKNCNIVFTSCRRKLIGTEGQILSKNWSLTAKSGFISGPDLIRKCAQLGTNLIGEPGAVLMRTSSFKKTSGFSIQIPYMIDIDLWIRLLEQGDAYLDTEVLFSFRISNQSWSSRIFTEHARQARQFVQVLYKNYPKLVRFQDYISGWILGSLLGYLRGFFFMIRKGQI